MNLIPFTVNIGRRGAPRLSFGVMAPSSAVAVDQHIDLAEVGERVEAIPVRAPSCELDLDAIRRAGL